MYVEWSVRSQMGREALSHAGGCDIVPTRCLMHYSRKHIAGQQF